MRTETEVWQRLCCLRDQLAKPAPTPAGADETAQIAAVLATEAAKNEIAVLTWALNSP